MNRISEKCIIKNSLLQSHEIVRNAVKEGDTVVDATAGNGGDTVFLAGLVGEDGKVFSFDIQKQAIENTGKKVKDAGFEKRVVLINDGHENIDRYIGTGSAAAIMFNLGYLPGGDHSIATKSHTTIAALESAMRIIRVNGIITVVVYYGGDSGFEEKERVLEYVKTIDCKRFTVSVTEFVNQINCPPILVCIEKLY